MIYREGKIVDRGRGSGFFRGAALSSNGLYASAISADFKAAAVLDGRSLDKLYEVRATGGEGQVASHVVSPAGWLAVDFSARNPMSKTIRSVLKVYGPDGAVQWSLPVAGELRRGSPIRGLTWSRDGHVLFYVANGKLRRRVLLENGQRSRSDGEDVAVKP